MAADFSTGLLSCFADTGICCYTYFCPFCQAADNWGKIRGKNCGLDDCCFLPLPYWTRQFIRTRKHMDEACFTDCLVMCCCTSCEICQEARELKNGFGLPPPTEYYYSPNRQPLMENKDGYQAAPQGYAPPPPQGYAPPPPQGYAPAPPAPYQQ